MNIKKLISNDQDLLSLFKSLTAWMDTDKSLWKKEDYPKLKPYFDYSLNPDRAMTKEESESFEFYKKCDAEYGELNSTIRNNLRSINEYDLAGCMGISIVEPDEDLENWDDLPSDYVVEKTSYPYILIMEIVSSYDRSGDFVFSLAEKVYLSDFEDVSTKVDYEIWQTSE